MHLALLGAGNIGQAILGGLLREGGAWTAERVRATRRSADSSAWNRSQPPNSSIISLYLTSERLPSGCAGSGAPSQRRDRKPPATVP